MNVRNMFLVAMVTTSLVNFVHAETILRLSHFWPATSKINTELFEKWKDAVELESKGNLKIQIYPGQTLSKADKTYSATVKGIANIGVTAQGYMNGRFPLTQVGELPGLSEDAVQGGCILQTLYDEGQISDEYNDSHVLFMFATGPGLLHTTDKKIQVPDDLKGLRIRRPTAVAGDLLESMGAMPSGIPAPDIYTSLQRHVIDGLSFPWEGMKTFKINEVAHNHTQIPFYTLAFVATMNKKDYEKLSPELKKVIDDNSGMKWVIKAGKIFNQLDNDAKKEAINNGDSIIVIDNPLENKDWKIPLEQGITKYINSLAERNLNGEDTYLAAKKASAFCKGL